MPLGLSFPHSWFHALVLGSWLVGWLKTFVPFIGWLLAQVKGRVHVMQLHVLQLEVDCHAPMAMLSYHGVRSWYHLCLGLVML